MTELLEERGATRPGGDMGVDAVVHGFFCGGKPNLLLAATSGEGFFVIRRSEKAAWDHVLLLSGELIGWGTPGFGVTVFDWLLRFRGQRSFGGGTSLFRVGVLSVVFGSVARDMRGSPGLL